jgi:predicted 2-oxoglutarate/Fe(II)-dependent dioxygenase YbiX
MYIHIHKSPIKYIEIRDFVEPAQLARWNTQLVKLPMAPGDVVTPTGAYTVNSVKRNTNAWLTPPNTVADEFRQLAWSKDVKTAIADMGDYLFLAHSTVDEGSFLYSEYTQGQYYEWHRDRTPYLTYNLILESAEEGGHFEMSTSTSEPYQITEQVANTANTLLIFPSFLMHRVKPIIKGRRRTLQYFLNASHVASQ